MPESFGRDRRLTQRLDFLRVYAEGKPFRVRGFVCHVARSGDRERSTRLGITVAKRVGRAHDRVRYKRWTREIFRRRNLRPGFDVIVTFRSEIAAFDFAGFEKALCGVFERARLFSDEDCHQPGHS